MNHEKTIERIQELTNGKVLEFGCKVIMKGEEYTITGMYQDNYSNGFYLSKNHNNSFSQINGEYCEGDFTEILGKPITLAVVLIAVEKFTGSSDNVLYVNSVGLMYIINSNKTQKDFIKQFENCVEWNLSKDNFNDQSEATKSFIGELLS